MAHLLVGHILYGYCGGRFGRDSMENKRVEAVGIDWVVAREGDDVVFASGKNIHEDLLKFTDKEKYDIEKDY